MISRVLLNMVVFNLGIFTTLDNDSYRYLRHCKKKIYVHEFDSKILFIYIFFTSLKFSFKYLTQC